MTGASKGSHRIPKVSGDEQDALSRRAKNYHRWRAGERASIKRKYNKRLRKSEDAALAVMEREATCANSAQVQAETQPQGFQMIAVPDQLRPL